MSTTTPKSPFDLYKIDLSEAKVKHSKAWYDERIKLMDPRKVTPAAIAKSGLKITSKIIPGKLYAFFYLPMTRAELPYYDTFPLAFPFSRNSETFHGLNLHYLDYQTRFILFKELLRISGLTNLNETAKIKMTWQLISGVSKMAPAQACVKQYRFDHLKSQFMEIEPKDWATALLLPTARFVGATQQSVWKQSNIIGRGW